MNCFFSIIVLTTTYRETAQEKQAQPSH